MTAGTLIGEYASGANTPTAAYVGGAGGLVKNLVTNRYYYQDASGSTSHLADSSGNLLEWYRYDLQGAPMFYNPGNTQILSSNYGVRHLFTGQQWYSELGLYDLRNRYYSPDIGRFLQADPSGFAGDATNLYRYCGNNPLKRSDPEGLSGMLTIYSNYGNVLIPGYTGHTWISYTPDLTGVTTFYGTYSNGLRFNYDGYQADVVRQSWIDDDAEALLYEDIRYTQIQGSDAWSILYNCTDFATGAWGITTGENLRAYNAFGVDSPSTVADSITAANGGSDYGYKDLPSSNAGDSGDNPDRVVVVGAPVDGDRGGGGPAAWATGDFWSYISPQGSVSVGPYGGRVLTSTPDAGQWANGWVNWNMNMWGANPGGGEPDIGINPHTGLAFTGGLGCGGQLSPARPR